MALKKFYTVGEVAESLGLSENTVRRLIARNQFARCTLISPARIAFSEKDLEEWLESRKTPAKGASQ